MFPAEAGDRVPLGPDSTAPVGNDGFMRNMARVRGPTAARSASRSSRQEPSTTQRHEPRHGAGQSDAVEHARVDRVGEDDLVARVRDREQGVEHVVAVAARDRDLRGLGGPAAPLDRPATASLRSSRPVNGR